MTDLEVKKKMDRIQLLEEKKRIRGLLPHLYRFKDYRWSKEFLESRNKMCLLTAANQIGKSSVQIRKIIHWATEPSLWPSLWPMDPVQFWYLYPSKEVATLEFETKWMHLLPQGEMKDHPQYGWDDNWDGKKIYSITFKSGVMVVFKTYAQDAQTLQSGTCSYIATDEELPADLYDELKFRLAASNGYFSCVFTATIGQEFWREAMEERGKYERFPHAAKWQVSMFDCLKYIDGTRSHWSEERIQQIIGDCQDEAEMQRRVYGKFVLSTGRTYSSFSIKENCAEGGPVPKDWLLFAGMDYGSGGDKGHPSAILFVAVKPDFTRGRIIDAWRPDRVQTTAGDVVQHFILMKNRWVSQGYLFVNCWYDHSARDLKTIADRIGEALLPAEKARDRGEEVANSLYRTRALTLDEENGEVMKLAHELISIRADASKISKKGDDLTDAMRFCLAGIPWNWNEITPPDLIDPPPAKEMTSMEIQNEARRKGGYVREPNPEQAIEDEFTEWNEAYGQ